MLYWIRGWGQKVQQQQKIMHFINVESNFFRREGGGYIQIYSAYAGDEVGVMIRIHGGGGLKGANY